MKTPLLDGELPAREVGANLQRGMEAVGGRLYLTSHRLIFESHAFNVQTGVTVIDRAAISGAAPCWTKFLGVIPIFPNSMEVVTTDGTRHQFVLMGRASWISALSAQPSGG
jgi:hypothetical protein